MKFKIYSLLLICLFGSIDFTDAQSPDQTKPFYFRALAWNSSAADLFYSQTQPPLPDKDDPGQSIADPSYVDMPLTVTAVGRSGFYPYKKDSPIFFVKHVGHLYKVVAKVDLLTVPNLPLLFFQKTNDPNSYNITVLPDDPDNFPGGAFRFINLSTIPVSVVLANRPSQILPHGIQTLTPNPSSGNRLELQVLRSSDGKRQYSNVWAFNKGVRYLIFLINDPSQSNSIVFLRLLDPVSSATAPNV